MTNDDSILRLSMRLSRKGKDVNAAVLARVLGLVHGEARASMRRLAREGLATLRADDTMALTLAGLARAAATGSGSGARAPRPKIGSADARPSASAEPARRRAA